MSQQQKLIFYSEHAQELVGSTDAKIRAILEQGCLEYVPESPDMRAHYLCHPIKNKDGTWYNKRTHRLFPHDKDCGGHTSCTCQGFNSRLQKWHANPEAPRPSCSHVAVLHELWSRQHRQRQSMGMFDVASSPIREE